jgi:ribosomal-protein-alanine N-acetyltransferase
VATEADLGGIVALEQEAFSDPWSRESFHGLLSQLALVADDGDGVAGYIVAHWAGEESEILNLAVRPELRRHGVARRLVEEAAVRLLADGVRVVFLEVRESNEGARAFYEGLGFEQVGSRPGYYSRPREDALVLARSLPLH